MKTLGFIARNEHGATLHLGNPKNPRKQLLEQLGVKSAVKMYCDFTTEPKTRHIGYIVGLSWWQIYAVCEWNGGKLP